VCRVRGMAGMARSGAGSGWDDERERESNRLAGQDETSQNI